MEPQTEQTESNNSTQSVLDLAIDLFHQGKTDEFNDFISQIPPSSAEPVWHYMLKTCFDKYGRFEVLPMAHRMFHFDSFKPCFKNQSPFFREQGIFFVNMPQLKTRVCLSYIVHPDFIHRTADFNIVILDQDGCVIRILNNETIKPGQTQTIEVAELLAGYSTTPTGTILIQTSEKNMGSFRVYACWYNEHSITTTHEKMAFLNLSSRVIYPTILADTQHETFLGICNLRNETLGLKLQLQNHLGQIHENSMNLNFKNRASCLLSVTQLFKNAETFLQGKPGAVCATKISSEAMYYYFIYNRRLGSWQCQHL